MDARQVVFLLNIGFISLFGACNEDSSNDLKQTSKIDTAKSFKLDGFWVTPKDTFGNYEEKVSDDTLKLVSCEEYIYSPFGSIKNKTGLRTSLLKNFQITERKDSVDGGIWELQILKLESNKLILFFDTDREASKESYVLKGEIYDNRVRFENGVKIGMNSDDFYKAFFDLFPKELSDRYKVVTISSCVDAITHIYDFKNGKLVSVKFGCIDCTDNLHY